MENHQSKIVEQPAYMRLTSILLGIVLLVFVMKEAKVILVPILIAGFLAVLISPFTSWLEKNRVPSALAAVISLISLLVILSGIVYFFYNQILNFSGDLAGLEARFSELAGNINNFTAEHFDGVVPISMDNVKEVLFQQIYDNMNVLTQGILATAGTLTLVFIIPVYIFLFIYYRWFIIEFFKKVFAKKHEDKVEHAILKIKEVVQKYIKGAFIVICILAVLNSIALYSLGIKHAMLFAVFAAILNVIPYLGPFLGAIFPIAFALLTKDSLWYPFGVFLAFYVIQLFESNLFTPKIVGGQVSMNPLMTIIALFIGNFIWGLAGMILFIPGMAILKVIFDEVEGMEAYGFLLGSVQSKKKKNLPKAKIVIEKVQKVFQPKKNNH
ncbi:AI-2E family transporter [Geofilum rubicundum]|uniref:Permease n=1 Tax=Geofilum rubicundum JCM 15548 TaxID=1236989 RepID=A0A0E9M206_9BACT|nr:AI-2E family transporter [Geofilum rubicundum]GAO31544.1 permease [Geofilum rubicundum JCM 15548]